MTTPDLLTRLRDLAAAREAATPGPWTWTEATGIGGPTNRYIALAGSLTPADWRALVAVVEAAQRVIVEYDKTHLTHDVDYEAVADAIDDLRQVFWRVEVAERAALTQAGGEG